MHFRSNVDGSDANVVGFNADDYRSFSWASQFSARLWAEGLSYAIVIFLIGIAAGTAPPPSSPPCFPAFGLECEPIIGASYLRSNL